MISVSRRALKRLRYILIAGFIVIGLDLLLNHQSSYPRLKSLSAAGGIQGTQSVYIASTQWNSGDLLQHHWIPSLLQVVSELKAANVSVYVSIYENGSWDATKSILRQLRQSLEDAGVENHVEIDDESHEKIITQHDPQSGWLQTAYGAEMRRIPYLARIRNKALDPLTRLSKSGTKFDKLLYLNDVIFSPSDVITLLGTGNGKYAAACALDFLNPPGNRVDAKTRGLHPPGMYDDFATRDSQGNTLGSHHYPYFSSRASKSAVMSGVDIPVQSCWNGIVAFDAKPFQSSESPLRFRGIPDSLAQYHVEASECCIVHYDNPLTQSLGVWINPAVRVGYSSQAYQAISNTQKGSEMPNWPTKAELRWGPWRSRWLWWIRDPGPVWKTWYRTRRWRRRFPEVFEPALACANDLAMVLTSNGWAMRGGRFE